MGESALYIAHPRKDLVNAQKITHQTTAAEKSTPANEAKKMKKMKKEREKKQARKKQARK